MSLHGLDFWCRRHSNDDRRTGRVRPGKPTKGVEVKETPKNCPSGSRQFIPGGFLALLTTGGFLFQSTIREFSEAGVNKVGGKTSLGPTGGRSSRRGQESPPDWCSLDVNTSCSSICDRFAIDLEVKESAAYQA